MERSEALCEHMYISFLGIVKIVMEKEIRSSEKLFENLHRKV